MGVPSRGRAPILSLARRQIAHERDHLKSLAYTRLNEKDSITEPTVEDVPVSKGARPKADVGTRTRRPSSTELDPCSAPGTARRSLPRSCPSGACATPRDCEGTRPGPRARAYAASHAVRATPARQHGCGRHRSRNRGCPLRAMRRRRHRGGARGYSRERSRTRLVQESGRCAHRRPRIVGRAVGARRRCTTG